MVYIHISLYIYIYIYIYITPSIIQRTTVFFFSPNRQGRSKDPVEAAGSAGGWALRMWKARSRMGKEEGRNRFWCFFLAKLLP